VIDLDSFINVAVRAWTQRGKRTGKGRRRRQVPPPVTHILVFDTETTIDAAQGLLFGAFRYCRVDAGTVTTVAEGLIYADDLPQCDPTGYATLQAYAASRKADVDLGYLAVEPNWQLQLVSRTEFVNRWLWHVGYPQNNRRDPATIVAFNAPFDLARIAVDVAEARADMYGGFSFTLWQDHTGKPAPWRPRLAIKSLDSKRAIKKFRRMERGAQNFTGHLLDLRTLVFALTGESHSLDSACAAFGVQGKASPPEFGTLSEAAIDYCRQDVAASTALYEAAAAEHANHPVDLQATVAYSPASVAKAYVRAMGIQARLALQPDFPPDVLGYAMAAFYGGRAEVRLRHLPVPIALVDFTSMYPTVDTLTGIWRLVTARQIDTVDVTQEVIQLLGNTALQDWFHPQAWKQLVTTVEVDPDGDVVPVRANYRDQDWSIGVNPLHADEPFWYTLPDLVASILLSGRAPTVRRALRFVPSGRQAGLQPVKLRGDVPVDPNSEDFFQRVVEARQLLRQEAGGHAYESCACEKCRTARFLKVLANSGSYGIYAEMIRHEQAGKVTVHPPDGEPFDTHVRAPETPGAYCFPPIAACITGAARLMLALLERTVTDAGGSWAFCDTDSMAIVATQDGGQHIPCPDGPHRLPNGTAAVQALSHDHINGIRARLEQLNPYQRALVPDVLKIETTGTCYAISAKRYVIYQRADDDTINILKRSEHGLGHYLNPLNPDEEELDGVPRDWVDEAWRWIIEAHDNPDTPLPDWANKPALSRITISSPLLHRPFTTWNRDKPWPEQIKPFNFILVATLDPFGLPEQAAPERFRLIAPYSRDSQYWARLPWRNMYDPDGPTYRITTDREDSRPDGVLVKSYGQVLHEYRLHPEHKFNGPDGQRCRFLTRGLLQRRPVHLAGTAQLIGKEANKLDEVQAGLHAGIEDVVTQYGGTTITGVLRNLVLPVLDRYSGRELARLVGSDRRTIDRIRAGQLPRSELARTLRDLTVEIAAADLPFRSTSHRGTVNPFAFLAAWRRQRRAATFWPDGRWSSRTKGAVWW